MVAPVALCRSHFQVLAPAALFTVAVCTWTPALLYTEIPTPFCGRCIEVDGGAAVSARKLTAGYTSPLTDQRSGLLDLTRLCNLDELRQIGIGADLLARPRRTAPVR